MAKSIAHHIAAILRDKQTFSLYAGVYLESGKSIPFPHGHCELEKRNNIGQVSTARYRYADNSTLVYQRKSDNQFSLTAKV